MNLATLLVMRTDRTSLVMAKTRAPCPRFSPAELLHIAIVALEDPGNPRLLGLMKSTSLAQDFAP